MEELFAGVMGERHKSRDRSVSNVAFSRFIYYKCNMEYLCEFFRVCFLFFGVCA